MRFRDFETHILGHFRIFPGALPTDGVDIELFEEDS